MRTVSLVREAVKMQVSTRAGAAIFNGNFLTSFATRE
jgi:hypothetical protein